MTVALYQNSGGTPQQRINWLVNAGWKTSTPSYISFVDFMGSDGTLLFVPNSPINNDLNDSTVDKKTTLKSLYVNFVRDDIRLVAKRYTDAEFPTTTGNSQTDALNRTKAELVINYFEGGQDDTIINYILSKNALLELYANHPDKNSRSYGDRSLLEQYGIADWLSAQDPTSVFTADEIANLAALEKLTAANQAQLETLKAAARAAKGLPPPKELSPEDTRNVNQCALLSDLLHKGLSYSAYPQVWGVAPRDTDADCKAFSGRIYPVTIDSFDPNSLVNICTMSSQVKNFFTNTNNTNGLEWYLTWVYMDSSKTLQEEQIFKSNANNTDMSDFETDLEAKKYFNGLPSNYLKTKKNEITTEKKNYTITSVDITYDGTNPSTARNDVKVKLTISLGSLAALNSICCYAPMSIDTDNAGGPDRSELVEIKISDLVAGTQANSYESRIIGHAESNQEFIPDTSRIRLKARTRYQPQKKDTGGSGVAATDDTDLILDLSVTGHEVSRDSTTGKSTLTINYRGYFEQAMNMPYNDALADETLITNREKRKERVRQARRDKCSNNLIREIMRTNQEQERIEVESFHKSGGLLKRLYDSGLIYSYSLDQTSLSVGQNGNIVDPRQNYVSGIIKDTSNISQTISRLKQLQSDKNRDDRLIAGVIDPKDAVLLSDIYFLIEKTNVDFTAEQIANIEKNKCFFLGDLMELLLDCMYKVNVDNSGKVISRTANMRDSAKGMNMRFVMGTIRVPDPKDLGKFITINPLQIPIDMAFFASWYHDTIVKKGITHYPVGTFMKDLIERLINDVIYDTCFALLLPDEQPPQLRMTFFSDCDTKWFKTYTASAVQAVRVVGGTPGTWFDPLDPYNSSPGRQASNRPHILMKKDIDFAIADTKNYCVIYQQNPSYFRQLKYQQTKKLKDDPYCPSIYYGYNMTSLNFLSNPKFTRSDTTYLKEARFFSNQLGNLSLLSNIYDVSFDIKSKKVNTFFYPGNIINFILTDFDGGGDAALSSWTTIETDIDESDPHKKGTLANTLGMGGYHVIKSVSYKIDNKENLNTTISIATKFMGTDAIGDKDPDSDKTPFADEQKRCITQYNTAVDGLRQTEGQTGIASTGIERIYDAGVTDSTESATTSPEATRVVIATASFATVDNPPPGGPPPTPATTTTPTDQDILKKKFSLTQAKGFNVGEKYTGDNIDNKEYTEDHIFEVTSITETTTGGRIVKWKITSPGTPPTTTTEEVTYE